MKCLVSGASGFIAQAVIRSECSHLFSTVGRKDVGGSHSNINVIDGCTDWSDALTGQEVVIHTAAVAHQGGGASDDLLYLYSEVNVKGTLNLAQQAFDNGVQRFIFISSVGVLGVESKKPFKVCDDADPHNGYTKSKYEAEVGLMKIANATGMEVVIIRPPLVYGFYARGSFASLVRWVKKGVPLPLGAVRNKRSLVGIDNLVSLIVTCIDHPAAANQTFLVSDGEDLSTTELLRSVANAMGRHTCLVPVPSVLLKWGATLLGKKNVAQQLLGSLQVDISYTRERLGWMPPLTLQQSLERCFEPKRD
ncbi:NAD-dependent epimerase/dehydratase family protein [Marinobacter sp. V034]|uniref:NAD-dependent epimerase/dehydratase family protein n=1 Tax=Marinobacter sp. V034 TaxID=3459610 RepID=UPI0040448893